jgi:hypothetical protein
MPVGFARANAHHNNRRREERKQVRRQTHNEAESELNQVKTGNDIHPGHMPNKLDYGFSRPQASHKKYTTRQKNDEK